MEPPLHYSYRNGLPFDRFAYNQIHGAQNGFGGDIQAVVTHGRRTLINEFPKTVVHSTEPSPVTDFPLEYEIKKHDRGFDDFSKIYLRPVRALSASRELSQRTIDSLTSNGKRDFARVMRAYVTSKSNFLRPTDKVTPSEFLTDEGINVLELSISIQEEIRKDSEFNYPITAQSRRVPLELWSVSHIISDNDESTNNNLKKSRNFGEQELTNPSGKQLNIYRGIQPEGFDKNEVLLYSLPSNPEYWYMFEVRHLCTLYAIYRCTACRKLKCSKEVNIEVVGDQFLQDPSSLPHSCLPLITKHVIGSRQKVWSNVEEKAVHNEVASGNEQSTRYPERHRNRNTNWKRTKTVLHDQEDSVARRVKVKRSKKFHIQYADMDAFED